MGCWPWHLCKNNEATETTTCINYRLYIFCIYYNTKTLRRGIQARAAKPQAFLVLSVTNISPLRIDMVSNRTFWVAISDILSLMERVMISIVKSEKLLMIKLDVSRKMSMCNFWITKFMSDRRVRPKSPAALFIIN